MSASGGLGAKYEPKAQVAVPLGLGARTGGCAGRGALLPRAGVSMGSVMELCGHGESSQHSQLYVRLGSVPAAALP